MNYVERYTGQATVWKGHVAQVEEPRRRRVSILYRRGLFQICRALVKPLQIDPVAAPDNPLDRAIVRRKVRRYPAEVQGT